MSFKTAPRALGEVARVAKVARPFGDRSLCADPRGWIFWLGGGRGASPVSAGDRHNVSGDRRAEWPHRGKNPACRWTSGGCSGVSLSHANRIWLQLLDNIPACRPRHSVRHGWRPRALDDGSADLRGRATRRIGVRLQQRRGAHGRPGGDSASRQRARSIGSGIDRRFPGLRRRLLCCLIGGRDKRLCLDRKLRSAALDQKSEGFELARSARYMRGIALQAMLDGADGKNCNANGWQAMRLANFRNVIWQSVVVLHR